MFGLFNKKKQEPEKTGPALIDLNHNPLDEGDIVESLRYGLGKCKVIKENGQFYYESLETGKKVSWVRMIDASTDLQKVNKVMA